MRAQDQIRDYVREMRRHFHAHPELSFEEFETTKRVAQELKAMGIEVQVRPEGTGLIGVVKGNRPGPCVALRADMDALNIDEKTNLPYASTCPGKMHACGHDAHTAMLLGAAKLIAKRKEDFAGSIILLFQPAEELGKGAPAMIEFGDWFEKVDVFFGTHVQSELPKKKVDVSAGARTASADGFKIHIKGRGGHGAHPEATVDAVVVGAAFVSALQTVVSRNYSPIEDIALTVGSFHAGSRFNIIAEEAFLEGTVRYFSKEVGETIEENIRRILDGVCATYGAEATMEYEYILGSVINDEKEVERTRRLVRDIFGEDALVERERSTGGEDFSFYIKDKPGVFVNIGVWDEEKPCYPHHNEHFVIDDEILGEGAALYAAFAFDVLGA